VTRARCGALLKLGPYENGRMVRCDLTAGHDGLHYADDSPTIRRWPTTLPTVPRQE
jgi:hypothetical protein